MSAENSKLFSVVVPVFNSQATLAELHARLLETFAKMDASYEIIFVDDYSQDSSWQVLRDLKAADANVKIVRLAKNYGQHNATFCGLRYATGGLVITIDDDLQHLPEEIPMLLDRLNKSNADLIYGIGKSKQSLMRQAGSQLWKWGSKRVDDGYGQGSSFRMIRQDLVQKIQNHTQHFIFLDELLFWYTNFIDVSVVTHMPRAKGKSGYGLKKLFSTVTSTTLLYGTWPLKLMVYGGSVLSVLSFLYAMRFLYIRLVYGVAVPGFTVTIMTILFSTSLMLICFGIIGKYLHNLYIVLNKKPVFSIKEVDL